MKKLLILALSLPTFAIAQSAPVFEAPKIAQPTQANIATAKDEAAFFSDTKGTIKKDVQADAPISKPSVAVPFGQ
jgi:hypothetical protein